MNFEFYHHLQRRMVSFTDSVILPLIYIQISSQGLDFTLRRSRYHHTYLVTASLHISPKFKSVHFCWCSWYFWEAIDDVFLNSDGDVVINQYHISRKFYIYTWMFIYQLYTTQFNNLTSNLHQWLRGSMNGKILEYLTDKSSFADMYQGDSRNKCSYWASFCCVFPIKKCKCHNTEQLCSWLFL